MEIITIRFKSRDWLGRIRTELRDGLESIRLGSREGRISLGFGELEKYGSNQGMGWEGEGLYQGNDQEIRFESRDWLGRRRLVSRK